MRIADILFSVGVPGIEDGDGGVHVVLDLLHSLPRNVPVRIGTASQALADVDQQLVTESDLLITQLRGGQQPQQLLISSKIYWAGCFHQPRHQNDLFWSMLNRSSKIYHFVDFWHSLCWRLWRTGMLLLTKSNGQQSIANEHTDTFYFEHFELKNPVNASYIITF